MDFPNPSKSAGSFVESIKGKLNFVSRNADKDDYAQEEYDYEDYAYDPNMANMVTMNRMRSTLMAIPIPIRTPRAILIARVRRVLSHLTISRARLRPMG